MIPCERNRIALSWSLRAGIVVFGLLCTALPGRAQAREPFRADRMDTVLYGVAYYPEYMPYDRLEQDVQLDRKSTRLNSSHQIISYAVFCLKKKIEALIPIV